MKLRQPTRGEPLVGRQLKSIKGQTATKVWGVARVECGRKVEGAVTIVTRMPDRSKYFLADLVSR